MSETKTDYGYTQLSPKHQALLDIRQTLRARGLRPETKLMLISAIIRKALK